jgi:hypothetical protein
MLLHALVAMCLVYWVAGLLLFDVKQHVMCDST